MEMIAMRTWLLNLTILIGVFLSVEATSVHCTSAPVHPSLVDSQNEEFQSTACTLENAFTDCSTSNCSNCGTAVLKPHVSFIELSSGILGPVIESIFIPSNLSFHWNPPD